MDTRHIQQTILLTAKLTCGEMSNSIQNMQLLEENAKFAFINALKRIEPQSYFSQMHHMSLNIYSQNGCIYMNGLVAAFSKSDVSSLTAKAMLNAALVLQSYFVSSSLKLDILAKYYFFQQTYLNKQQCSETCTVPFLKNLPIAFISMSDRASQGIYPDIGIALSHYLINQGAVLVDYQLLPDDSTKLVETLDRLLSRDNIDVIFVRGGTGLSIRDITTQTLSAYSEMQFPGLAELLHKQGSQYLIQAWLSNGAVYMKKQRLIISFPGTKQAFYESLDALYLILMYLIKNEEVHAHL